MRACRRVGTGLQADRNCKLLFSIPNPIAAKLALINSENPVTSEDSLGKRYMGSTTQTLTRPVMTTKAIQRLNRLDMKSFAEFFASILK